MLPVYLFNYESFNIVCLTWYSDQYASLANRLETYIELHQIDKIINKNTFNKSIIYLSKREEEQL